MIHFNIDKFQSTLSSWYAYHHRNLPWRETKNPYKIWISEIILQQTRVNQGMEYYLNFIKEFPTVSDLAKADEQEVLKLWQGLGYYSRARNLHKSAKIIEKNYDGKFPMQHNEILQLPGIGEYTAAAISSFAFNEAYAAVDGNVSRFLARLTGSETPINSTKGKKEFQKSASILLDKKNPGTHNQGMIEFGAIQCVPKNPKCSNCCFNHLCRAYEQNLVDVLPVKSKQSKIKNRYFHYFHINLNDFTYLQKRETNDIWKNLYEFPLIETKEDISELILKNTDEFKNIFTNKTEYCINSIIKLPKHVLSHQHIFATFYHVSIRQESERINNFTRLDYRALGSYPISRLTEKYLEKDRNNSL